ncbi:hypothetical protein [Histophilus somni]|nr:hypothetical protein [Histophilus somni]
MSKSKVILIRYIWCYNKCGAWCMVHGAWCMVHGAWCMVHGACFDIIYFE